MFGQPSPFHGVGWQNLPLEGAQKLSQTLQRSHWYQSHGILPYGQHGKENERAKRTGRLSVNGPDDILQWPA